MSDRYFERIKRYMRSMKSRARMTEEAYEEAATSKPPFYKPAPGAPALRPIEKEGSPALRMFLPGLFDDDPTIAKPAPVGTKSAPPKPKKEEKKTLWPF